MPRCCVRLRFHFFMSWVDQNAGLNKHKDLRLESFVVVSFLPIKMTRMQQRLRDIKHELTILSFTILINDLFFVWGKWLNSQMLNLNILSCFIASLVSPLFPQSLYWSFHFCLGIDRLYKFHGDIVAERIRYFERICRTKKQIKMTEKSLK